MSLWPGYMHTAARRTNINYVLDFFSRAIQSA